jgi:hypothetical protein
LPYGLWHRRARIAVFQARSCLKTTSRHIRDTGAYTASHWPMLVSSARASQEDRRPAIAAEGRGTAGQGRHQRKWLGNSGGSPAAPSRACERPVISRERLPR